MHLGTGAILRKWNLAKRPAVIGRVLACVLPMLIVTAFDAQTQVTHSAKQSGILRKFPLTKFYDTPDPLASGKPGELIRSAPFEQYVLSSGVSAVRILYYSRSGNGELVASSGVVLYPDEKPPAGGWPVIAWAHKLSGVARTCAPSLERNLLHGPFLSMYVNLGYAVVATDYTGLGSNFRNAFADMRSNAQDLIYSIPAARAAVPGLGSRWIAMGTGEGSTAVLGVSELERETPDSNFLGGVAISRIADVEDLMEPSGNQSHDLPLALAYGIQTLYPKFEPKDLLTDAALPLYRQVGESCSVPAAGDMPVASMLRPNWKSNKFVQDYFERNRLAKEPASAPLLVIDSEGDPLIVAAARVVGQLCKLGDQVLFNRYSGYDPGQVIGDSTRDQMAWIQERFANRPARTNCSTQH